MLSSVSLITITNLTLSDTFSITPHYSSAVISEYTPLNYRKIVTGSCCRDCLRTRQLNRISSLEMKTLPQAMKSVGRWTQFESDLHSHNMNSQCIQTSSMLTKYPNAFTLSKYHSAIMLYKYHDAITLAEYHSALQVSRCHHAIKVS
jgi:hypothetical protein